MLRAGAPSQTGSSETSDHTILVVEDEVLIRLPVAEYLRDSGFRVFEAADAVEAKAVLKADTPIDLMFTDINMPGGENGLMLAMWVRQHYPGTEVLVTSGIANAAEKARDPRVNAGFVAKPYQYAAVLQRIQRLLRQARKTGSGRSVR
jgi:DNA-binding response OmpR family regulator